MNKIEKLKHPFSDLTIVTFPKYLNDLIASKEYSFEAMFSTGRGVKTALKGLSLVDDFAGLYIFINPKLSKSDQVVYVGISQKVISRLHQHAKGYNHFSGNMAYKLTKELVGHTGSRNELKDLKEGRKIINGFNFKFIKIENEIERYLFEVYVHLHFKTKYNSFETH